MTAGRPVSDKIEQRLAQMEQQLAALKVLEVDRTDDEEEADGALDRSRMIHWRRRLRRSPCSSLYSGLLHGLVKVNNGHEHLCCHQRRSSRQRLVLVLCFLCWLYPDSRF